MRRGLAVIGVDEIGRTFEFRVVGFQPFPDLIDAHLLSRRKDAVEVIVAGQLLIQFGTGFLTRLGVVLRDELLVVILEGNPRFLSLEKAHER